MSRSICTVFVALAIFQGAFAINVEPHSVINVDLTKEASPSGDLFADGRSFWGFVGDLTYGERRSFDTVSTGKQDYTNDLNDVVEADLQVTINPDTAKIHYVNVVNAVNSTAVVCYTKKTLGSNVALLKVRLPAKSNTTLSYTVRWH